MGISTLISPLSSLLDKVFDKVLPSDMDKATAEKIRAEAKSQLIDSSLREKGDFRKFILAYEGQASDLHPAMAAFRASLRPVISYLVYGTVIWMQLTGQEISSGMWKLVLIITAFWFGERAVRGVAPALRDMLSGKK